MTHPHGQREVHRKKKYINHTTGCHSCGAMIQIPLREWWKYSIQYMTGRIPMFSRKTSSLLCSQIDTSQIVQCNIFKCHSLPLSLRSNFIHYPIQMNTLSSTESKCLAKCSLKFVSDGQIRFAK